MVLPKANRRSAESAKGQIGTLLAPSSLPHIGIPLNSRACERAELTLVEVRHPLTSDSVAGLISSLAMLHSGKGIFNKPQRCCAERRGAVEGREPHRDTCKLPPVPKHDQQSRCREHGYQKDQRFGRPYSRSPSLLAAALGNFFHLMPRFLLRPYPRPAHHHRGLEPEPSSRTQHYLPTTA